MDYGNILSRAWNIVWGNKWLFILGFLAALGSSGGSSGGSGGRGNVSTTLPDDFGSQLPGNFSEIMSTIAPFIVVLVCFFFVLAIVLWLLRLVGEAGMIASVDRIEAGEKLTFGDGFSAGTAYLPKMIGLTLVLYGPFLLVGLIMAAVGVGVAATGFSGGEEVFGRGMGLLALCLVPLGCILAIFGIIVAFVYPMAQRGIIIESLGVMDGIRRGWQVLRQNIGEILLLAIIFAIIGFIVGIVSLIIAVPLALIFALPAIMAAIEGSAAFTMSTIALGIVGVIVFILLAAAITSIVRTFQSAAFTLAYHQWMGKAKIVAADG